MDDFARRLKKYGEKTIDEILEDRERVDAENAKLRDLLERAPINPECGWKCRPNRVPGCCAENDWDNERYAALYDALKETDQ